MILVYLAADNSVMERHYERARHFTMMAQSTTGVTRTRQRGRFLQILNNRVFALLFAQKRWIEACVIVICVA